MPEYRGSLGAEQVVPAKDFPVATAGSIKKGDLVTLNASGQVVKAVNTDTTMLGVSEGKTVQTEYEKNNNIENQKVRASTSQLIGIGYSSGAPTVGVKYAITTDANGVQKLNTGAAVTGEVKVLEVVSVNTEDAEAKVIITASSIG